MLSQRQDGSLSALERARLRLHLWLCEACARFAGQLEFLRRAMRHYCS